MRTTTRSRDPRDVTSFADAPPTPRPTAPRAAGRGRFGRVFVAAVVVGLGCQTVQGVPDAGSPPPPPVVIEAGPASPSDERAAAALLREAEASLEAGATEAAIEAASAIVENYPTTTSSGAALWVRARALGTSEAGAEQVVALDDLERLLPLLGSGDPRRTPATLLYARVLAEAGRIEEAVVTAVSLPSDATVDAAEMEWMREVVAWLDLEAIEDVARTAPPTGPLVAPLWVALGRARGVEGDAKGAREAASLAISAGATGADREEAEALLAGEGIAARPELAEWIPLAALLPASGSPALRGFANEVREGALAALTAAGLAERSDVEVYDDGGDPEQAAALVRAIEASGAFGIVGPVQDAALAAAARARTSGVPIVSPTAFSLPDSVEGIYSLGSLDPGSARALAAWAAEVGFATVAIIHPSDEASSEEARLFAEAFEAAGGSVLQTLTYPPGQTFFQEQIRAAASVAPEALVLPVPPADVEALAPQVTFYGLDTLGIQILGTSAWTDGGVREAVSDRHLSGVVVASPDLSGREGWNRFVEAYETRFRRTLVAPGGAPLGYDAASLLLEAARSGARSGTELAEALEAVDGFEGATGLLSVEDGRVVRRHSVVCYDGAVPEPIAPGRPVQRWRAYPPPADTTDTVPPGPGRRDGFACPGTRAARIADSVFFANGGDTLYPEIARILRPNDTLPQIHPDEIIPGR
ncbi:MAG: ABC transporter substrate-binding protein [Longimicrobiales bacterium]|nr:ABC transporter substrate-binding protein [Longimicrobiales bacterium]